MSDSTKSLEEMIAETRRLMVGPDPRKDAQRIDLSTTRILLPKKGPYVDREGNEILRTERPTNVYGVAVLFPNTNQIKGQPPEQEPLAPDPDETVSEDSDPDAEQTAEDTQALLLRRPDDDPDEPPAPSIQTKIYRPRSMGISFLCQPEAATTLEISVCGGRYEFFSLSPDKVELPDGELAQKTTRLYRHNVVSGTGYVPISNFPVDGPRAVDANLAGIPAPLKLRVEVFIRPLPGKQFLITVTLINEAIGMNNDQNCLFQSRFSCKFTASDGRVLEAFKPYPEKHFSEMSDEDRTMDLLYREMPRFATGHGCSADWKRAGHEAATEVVADPMPEFWVDTITADIPGSAPQMKELCSEGWQKPLREMLESYDNHIKQLDLQGLPPNFRDTAGKHKAQAEQVVRRMREGLKCLQEDPIAERAFQLANEAMRLQQIASRIPQRAFESFLKGSAEPKFSPEWESTLRIVPTKEPTWRAFQIAFLLTNIVAIVKPDSQDRSVVDLIWFPTGGGKTEAYLGLIAFACFHERLRNERAPRHVQVLMRYTMRLLTAQQFQRAASLVCAMESIRFRGTDQLGEPITLGIWVGNALTPNTKRDARDCVATLRNGGRPFQSLFLHSQCPWCGAQVGTAHDLPKITGAKAKKKVLGVADDDDSTFYCSDPKCHFYSNALPFHVVDEVLLGQLPTILIATVDKFALLPKKPKLRQFFGISEDGNQVRPAPSLIVQDELHLVSEALGSMVGAYEALIHALCCRGGTVPKIVCSTATIRTYKDQIRCLFARDRVCVFPPPEFSIGQSFFARVAVDATGKTVKRKAFVGVFGSGYLSFQTAEAITLASLLQGSMALPRSDDERDPFWTLLCFFSTLRELGTTLTLMHSAVRNRIRNIAYWRGLDPKEGQRLLHRVEELTSRASSHELTRIMTDLGQRQSSARSVDACLATSIVEVGIDIPRLSLLCVVGQPKKTSTYVQATGRVGRLHPALVVTLFDHTRARDRSVYESFRSFHERMYAGVEPTSLTPFAAPVQERALAALLAAYARLTSPENGLANNPSAVEPNVLERLLEEMPGPFETDVKDAHVSRFIEFLVSWVEIADPNETQRLIEGVRRRIREWKDWQRREWHCWTFNFNPVDQNPMMLDIDPMAKESSRGARWYVPNSMRDVDSEAQLWVYPGGDLPMIPGGNDELFPAEQVP